MLDTTQLMGSGGIDYVYADNDDRRVYVPRGGNTFVFDLDSHKYIGAITNIGGHGVAIDTAYASRLQQQQPAGNVRHRNDAEDQKTFTFRAGPTASCWNHSPARFLFSATSAPSITVIDPKDGTVTGTIDVGGAMEQAQSDGQGKLYVDVEDEKKIAVVDMKTHEALTKYDLGDSAGEPGGLGFDVKNHVLFAMCANPNVCVVLNANDGKVLATLPLDGGTDGGGFNPATMEAWSSQGNGTLTIIKESSPTSFAVGQTVQTKQGCKTSSLDTKNNRIVLVCTERAPQAAAATNAPAPAADMNAPGGGRRGGRGGGPGNLDVLWVGR